MIKNRILIFAPNYLPGFKAGGILRTLANTVEWLGDEFDFLIVTSDRDLGDSEAYSEIEVNKWQKVGGAKVLYLSPKKISLSTIVTIINHTAHDLIYLNSFFDSKFTIRVLLAKRLGYIKSKYLILAPRGEFTEGSLRYKYLKKILYIKISRWLRFYKNIIWHASSRHEVLDIVNVLELNDKNIRVALDLPVRTPPQAPEHFFAKSALQVVFLSRLTREKNLDYALEILSKVKSSLTFDIYGPNEDSKYWVECCEKIKKLPKNIQVSYLGPVNPNQVSGIFSKYDLFFFPTRGENYGHVIAESVSVGTRVLISKNTPWLDLVEKGIGWDFELDDINSFVDLIEEIAKESSETKLQKRAFVREAAMNLLMNSGALTENRKLFQMANNWHTIF